MSVRYKFKRIIWLCDTTDKKLATGQGLLYMWPDPNPLVPPKFGLIKASSYTGATPVEAFERRYPKSSHKIDQDNIELFVYEIDDNRLHDDKIRAEIHKRYIRNPGRFPFDAYDKVNHVAPQGINNESCLGYNYNEHSGALLGLIKEYFGILVVADTRDPWIPREADQENTAKEIAKKLKTNARIALNGHTGYAKIMITMVAIHRHIYPSDGAFILATTPVIDTLSGIISDATDWYYGGNRCRRTVVYDREALNNGKTIAAMRQEADNGDIVFLSLSVQDMRFQDNASLVIDDKELREKYKDLISDEIEIDLWIRDEAHFNYAGLVTSKVFASLDDRCRYIIDTSASINKIANNYHPDSIIDRGLFWALAHETERKTPHIHIESLSGMCYDTLSPDVREVYNETEGWSPSKMTELLPNGQFRSLIAINYILEKQYICTDEKEENPLSIINDIDLPYKCRRVGMHLFPEGVNGTPANIYLKKLADDLNAMPQWSQKDAYGIARAIFITPYNFKKHAAAHTKSSNSYRDVIDYLMQTYTHVVILTHRRWILGSNIPPLGHAVQWDKIVDPYCQEQFAPGRLFRIMPWKTAIKIYDLAPGHYLQNSISEIAASSSKILKQPDVTILLRNISFTRYEKGIGMRSWTPEEVFRPYNNMLTRKSLSTIGASILTTLSSVEINALASASSSLKKNKVLGTNEKTQLVAETGTEKAAPKNQKRNKQGKAPVMNDRKTLDLINNILLEIPFVAVSTNILLIDEILDHSMIRRMFNSIIVDTLLNIIANNQIFKHELQDKLTDIHLAFGILPFLDMHDEIFKNTTLKKGEGIVFVNCEAAEFFANEFIRVFAIPKHTTETVAVGNALSGSIPFYLQKLLPCANIICIENSDYYISHLKSLGFTCIKYNNLKENMVKIKYWAINAPYQKDAGGVNDSGNKQGSYWFAFVEKIFAVGPPDAKIFSISPKAIFGAGNYGKSASKVAKICNHGNFVHIWPDLGSRFPGVSIPICGYAIDLAKTTPYATVDGYADTDTVIINSDYPAPFYFSPAAVRIIQNSWQQHKSFANFVENLNAKDDNVVLRVNGGRFKLWKKLFVGFDRDTQNNLQGAVINDNELPGYLSASKCKLWEYIFKVMGCEKGNSVTGVFQHLPIMDDMTRSYTDQEWFSAFNIDEQMQREIAKFLREVK